MVGVDAHGLGTGDGIRSSEAQALPECAAMPAWSAEQQHRLGLDALDAEADDVGQPLDRVAVDRDARKVRDGGQGALGQATAVGLLPGRARAVRPPPRRPSRR